MKLSKEAIMVISVIKSMFIILALVLLTLTIIKWNKKELIQDQHQFQNV